MKTDFFVRIPVSVPHVIYPYHEDRTVVFLVVYRVGSSVRIYTQFDNYADALNKAAELSINYYRNYFVLMVDSYIRVL